MTVLCVMAFMRRLLKSGARSKKSVNGAAVSSGSGNNMSSEEGATVDQQMAGLSLQDGGGDREIATFAMS